MNYKYLLLQFFFFSSVFVNLFIDKNIFLKVLLICLLFFYGLLILPEFKHNRERFVFSYLSFIIISILFIFIRYTKGTTYLVILSCLLVLFMYLSRTLFSTTIGKVLDSTRGYYKIKIIDEFYNYGKIVELKSTKKYAKNSIVLLGLDLSIFRKPTIIIKQLEPKPIKNTKTNKTTKKPTKTNIKKKK